jgi:hypothetical protein
MPITMFGVVICGLLLAWGVLALSNHRSAHRRRARQMEREELVRR